MCSTPRATACAALLACLAVLAAGCGDDGAQPAPVTTAAAPPAPLRTLYVQAPLTGPAADEGRAMVDAVRLVVGQARGLAGDVRVIVRTLDDGGVGTRDRSAALRRQRRPRGRRSPVPWP